MVQFGMKWYWPSDQPDSESDQNTDSDSPTATRSEEITLDSDSDDHDQLELEHAAFCMTSYFLSKLLMRSLGTGRNLQGIPKVQRTQLKILNAFLTIAVIDSEVVSVVAETQWGPTLHLIMAFEGHKPFSATEGYDHPVDLW